jgi:iron complex transport system ATP-binding protein
MKPILHTEHLSIGYHTDAGEKTIQKDLNLKLFEGQLICLIGANGVGKSTLLRTLSGVQKPLKGKVLLAESTQLHSLKPKERAQKISLVLTEKMSAGNLRVEELLALGRYPFTNWAGQLQAEDKLQVDQVITDLGLENLRQEALYTLSDGQQQKALIARALVQNGDIIILDEPTAHLDIPNKMAIMRLLREIAHKHRKAILVATHEIDLALQVADTFWLMSEQQALIAGMPEELILDGSLADVFQATGLTFDMKQGRFKLAAIKKKPIHIQAPEAIYYWLGHALEKSGYYLADEAHHHISITDQLEWQIQSGNELSKGNGIAALLCSLNELTG